MTQLETFLELIKPLPSEIKRNLSLLEQTDKMVQECQYAIEQKYPNLVEEAQNEPIPVPPHRQVPRQAPNKAFIVGIQADELTELRQMQRKCYELICEKVAIAELLEKQVDSFCQRLDLDLAQFKRDLGDACPQTSGIFTPRADGMGGIIGQSLPPPPVVINSSFGGRQMSSSSSVQTPRTYHKNPRFMRPVAEIQKMQQNVSTPVLRSANERRLSATLTSQNHVVTSNLATDIHRLPRGGGNRPPGPGTGGMSSSSSSHHRQPPSAPR